MAGEGRLWEWLSKARAQLGDELDMNRIENSVGAGMADVEGIRKGFQFWCELKSEDRPARPTTPIRYTWQDKQVPWLKRRWSLGGRAFALCSVGRHPHRVAYLIPAVHLGDIENGVPEAKLAEVGRAFRTSTCHAKDVVLSMCGAPKTHLKSLVVDGPAFFAEPPFTTL